MEREEDNRSRNKTPPSKEFVNTVCTGLTALRIHTFTHTLWWSDNFLFLTHTHTHTHTTRYERKSLWKESLWQLTKPCFGFEELHFFGCTVWFCFIFHWLSWYVCVCERDFVNITTDFLSLNIQYVGVWERESMLVYVTVCLLWSSWNSDSFNKTVNVSINDHF